MPPIESLEQFIERLAALPPRRLLEAYRAIGDPVLRQKVANGLPFDKYGDMMAESMCDNIGRVVREQLAAQNLSDRAA